MVLVCFTFSISLSFMLSALSELPAAKTVIPLRIVTTSSVLRLVVRKVFNVATLMGILLVLC